MASAELLNTERERSFDLYQSQANSFRRSLYWLLMLSVIVFTLFVVPFLGFSVQLNAIKKDAAAAQNERQRNQDMLAQRQAELVPFSDLTRLLAVYAQQAREVQTYERWIGLARSQQQPMQSIRESYLTHSDTALQEWARGEHATLPPDVFTRVRGLNALVTHSCDWRLSGSAASIRDYTACRACESFQQMNDQVTSRLGRLSVDRLPEGIGPQNLTAVVDRACGFLLDGDIHWHRNEPLHPDPNRIRGFITHDIKAYYAAIGKIGTGLSAALPNTVAEIEALETQLVIAKENETEILTELDRLAKFDRLATPFGDVPITLNQLALLFPIAVAVSFLVIAASFGRMTTLRRAFVQLSLQSDSQSNVINTDHLNAIAPVWLSRHEGPVTFALKWLILLIPAALILMTYALVHQSGTFAARFPEGSAMSSTVYYILYAGALVLVAGGIGHIWRASRLAN